MFRHPREGGEMDSRLKCNTFEVFIEYFVWCFVAKAFSRCLVISLDDCIEFALSSL